VPIRHDSHTGSDRWLRGPTCPFVARQSDRLRLSEGVPPRPGTRGEGFGGEGPLGIATNLTPGIPYPRRVRDEGGGAARGRQIEVLPLPGVRGEGKANRSLPSSEYRGAGALGRLQISLTDRPATQNPPNKNTTTPASKRPGSRAGSGAQTADGGPAGGPAVEKPVIWPAPALATRNPRDLLITSGRAAGRSVPRWRPTRFEASSVAPVCYNGAIGCCGLCGGVNDELK